VPDLYSANVGYPGMNLQIAATLDGALIAGGPRPVHGARHDAHGSPSSGPPRYPVGDGGTSRRQRLAAVSRL
jgi:hypothetical protein